MSRFNSDRLLIGTLRTAAAISACVVVLIVVFLLVESATALATVGPARFATDGSWHPTADSGGAFGLLPILAGTALSAVGATLLAGPLGIVTAAFLEFYAPPFIARWYRRIVELMAGVPSVVYGLWGLTVLVPLIAKWQPPGSSLLAGIIILALMILPTVVLLSSAALAAVPVEYLRGASALGFTQSAATFRVAIPAAKSGLIAAVVLALARAIGETMAVLMVAGNVVRLPGSLFDPVRTLTATIALEMGYARGDHRSALFVCGLVLMLFVAVLIAVVEWMRRGERHATL